MLCFPFLCGVVVNRIPACGVVTFSNITVCDACVLMSKGLCEPNYLRCCSFLNFRTSEFPNALLHSKNKDLKASI